MRGTLSERFWIKVDKNGPLPVGLEELGNCWIWSAAYTNPRGYGVIVDRGRNKQAHRVAYELEYGPIPLGLFACHRCDVRLCVRPTHIFAGTHEQNQADKIAKGRSVREQHHSAKLTWPKVEEIRRRHAKGETYAELGRQFRVSRVNIRNIMIGRSWATPPPVQS